MRRTAWTSLAATANSSVFEVHLNMEVHYLQLIRRTQVDISPKADSVHLMMAHVQLVVWGSLMIESLANRLRRRQISETVDPSVLESEWEKARWKSTIEKLKQAGKHFPKVDRPAWLAGEFELRDRLVHYKEMPVTIDTGQHLADWHAAGKPGEFLETLPPMGIHADLLKTPIADRQGRHIEYGTRLYEIAMSIGPSSR